MKVIVTCPKHGTVESNSDGYFNPEIPISEYCLACVGEAQKARYDAAVKRAKAKKPNWKPLSGSVFVGR